MAAVNAFKQFAEKAKAEAKRKADEERFGDIWAFADEKKKQYPNMPDNIYANLRNCITKAEAKRVWKNHLVKPPEGSHVDLGPRWMVPI